MAGEPSKDLEEMQQRRAANEEDQEVDQGMQRIAD